MVCPEEWGESFGEEFYDFSLDNALYYSPQNADLRISEKSKPVDGQLSFPLMSGDEIIEMANKIKAKAGNEDE